MKKEHWYFIGNVVGAVILMQVLHIRSLVESFFFLVGLNLYLSTRDK